MLIPRQDLRDADHKDFIWWGSFYKNLTKFQNIQIIM